MVAATTYRSAYRLWNPEVHQTKKAAVAAFLFDGFVPKLLA